MNVLKAHEVAHKLTEQMKGKKIAVVYRDFDMDSNHPESAEVRVFRYVDYPHEPHKKLIRTIK